MYIYKYINEGINKQTKVSRQRHQVQSKMASALK